MLRIGAHRDLGHINVAIGDRLQREVLARGALAGRGEFRHRAERRRLRRLAAGVGIDLGVEHQHVDVAAAGQHVIEPAVADVVGPAVAADDPDAAADQMIDDRQQIQREPARAMRQQPRLQLRDADALRADFGFLDLRRLGDGLGEIRARLCPRVAASSVSASSRCLSAARRKPRPNSALSSNSEFDQAGPRPSAFFVHGVTGRLPP